MTHNMCECNAPFIYTVYSVVCTSCGVEKTFLSTKIQTYSSSPQSCIVISPYSRKQRFTSLLRKIIGVDSGPPRTDKVWQLLAQSAPFQNTQEIICCLKNSNLKTKYYNSLHIFSKAFLNNYNAPVLVNTEPLKVEKRLEKLFDEVLFRWNRFQNDQSFFSYAWLIEKLLKHIYLYNIYKSYLKVLICPNRRRKYEERWDDITKLPLKDWLPSRSGTRLVPLGTV